MAEKSDIERAVKINDNLGFSPANFDFADLVDVAHKRALRSAVRHLAGDKDFTDLLDPDEIRIPERFQKAMPVLVDCFIDGFKAGYTTKREDVIHRGEE